MGENAPARPSAFEDRFRLYIDESGDHVYREVAEPAHRFLCLCGVWFKNPAYFRFHREVEEIKARHLHHHPDEPVVLHREDMLHARKAFSGLREPAARQRWDDDLIAAIGRADFCAVAVVIDKLALRRDYGEAAAHPYHLGLGFLLQRYAGYLNHINRRGDVMAESRGGREDRLLKESYTRVFNRGAWMVPANTFQTALTSSQLKLKNKKANIAGLQLADLLGHPLKNSVLRQNGLVEDAAPPFAARLLAAVENKLNRHLYRGTVEGYGTVLYPKP